MRVKLVLIFRHQNKPIVYRKKPEDKLSMWNINIKIDGKKIEPSSHVKYLGILINSFLNWNFHIDELSTKLSCAVGMLAKIRHYINEKKLSMVYHGIFSSLLLYGSQIWGQSNQSVSKMEKLQNKPLRIINFKPFRYSVNSLYNKCEILKFGASIKLSNFLYAHGNIKGNLPTTLCAGITLVDSKHSQITRNQKGNQVNIPTVRSKTSGANSIKSKSVNTWNDLNKLFIKKQFVNQKRNFCKSLIKSYFIKGYV